MKIQRPYTHRVPPIAGDVSELVELQLEGGHLRRRAVRVPGRTTRLQCVQVHVRVGDARRGAECRQ